MGRGQPDVLQPEDPNVTMPIAPMGTQIAPESLVHMPTPLRSILRSGIEGPGKGVVVNNVSGRWPSRVAMVTFSMLEMKILNFLAMT